MSDIIRPIITDATGIAIAAAISQTDVAQARIAEINEAAEAKKQEVLASIPQDYTALSEEVEDLKVYVTPQMYGAIGDGTNDDTTAFQTAINSGLPVLIPSGSIITVKNAVTIQNSTVIFGHGEGSVLRVSGSITTDSDSSHTLEIFGIKFECYKVTGTALIINKQNNSNAKNCFSMHDMVVYNRNNVSDTLDNTCISIMGIREAAITNVVFKGDSSAYGRYLIFSGDQTHETMNITISGCNFYSCHTFVELDGTQENKIYLAGFRFVNTMFIAGTYGINARHVDTFTIDTCMFDFVTNPIESDTCGVVTVNNNYIQSHNGAAAVHIVNNHQTSESRFHNIINNFIWSVSEAHTMDGVLFEGIGAKIVFSTVRNNKFTAVNHAVNFRNCQNCYVSDNVVHNSNVFFNGRDGSQIIHLENNHADASVGSLFIRTNASCYVLEGNTIGVNPTLQRGKSIMSGDGTTKKFSIHHFLSDTPQWAIASIGSNLGAFAVQYDAEGIYILFETAPPAGEDNIVVNWEAAVAFR